MGELASDVDQRWVCPNDRQLALRAKLNSGWSFHSSGPARKTKPGTNISDTEQEVIRNVLNRAERIRHVEEERIGRLVEKLENMRNNAIGDGKETCLLCGSKFGTLKVIGKPCDICNQCVCDKCGVKTCDSEGDDIWLCMLCSEQRELWKRTGAWFFQAIPKYSHPGRADRTDTGSSGSFSDQLSVPQSYSRSRTWTSYSRSRDNLDEDIREKSDSEEEESSSSSDEMSLIDRPKKKSLLSSGRDRSSTSEELSNLFYGTPDSASMPGREILENIDTPPPFRKRTLAVSQSDYPAAVPPHQDTNTSHNTSSLPSANGQLLHAANGRHTKAKSPIAPNQTAGSLNGEGGQVDGKTKGLVKKQDTEEEDIDEIVRSFKESEAATPEDGGGAGLGTLDFSVHYEKQHSRLQVTVSCAKGLKAMDSSGTSDPYVKLHLLPGASKKTKLRTHTKYKTLNPKFEETLVYHGITDEDMSKKSLRLQVFDEDKLGRNNFIGETCVALKIFHSKPSQSLKRSLVSKAYSEDGRESPEPDLGRIQLTLKYKSQKGQLVVGVIRCAGLAAMDTNGYSDPYVKCYLKPDVHKKSKRRTSVKKKTLNPEFNEEFTYEIQHHDLAKKSLEVTVWDHDVGKSNDFIGGISMDINAKGSVLKHWYATLKTPNQVHTYWHTLESLANQDQES